MKKLSQKNLANLVSARRKEKGITQQQLADRTGINRAMLSHIESEEYIPSILQLQVLGDELGFDLEDVFRKEAIGEQAEPEGQEAADPLFRARSYIAERRREQKPVRIAVAGTGYVGLSLATLLSQNNPVTAVDILPEKVEMINHRKSPIQDDYIEKYFAEKELKLTATTDGAEAYRNADFVIISTPTNYDSKKNYFDTSAVEAVIELVKSVNPDAVMIIKSTIPVGYTSSVRKKY